MARMVMNMTESGYLHSNILMSVQGQAQNADFKDFQHIRCIISISDPLSLGSRIDRTLAGCEWNYANGRGRTTSMCHGILARESTGPGMLKHEKSNGYGSIPMKMPFLVG